MLMTGSEYLESIRDGRRVYIGSERVDDVTTHRAFRNATTATCARTICSYRIRSPTRRVGALPRRGPPPTASQRTDKRASA